MTLDWSILIPGRKLSYCASQVEDRRDKGSTSAPIRWEIVLGKTYQDDCSMESKHRAVGDSKHPIQFLTILIWDKNPPCCASDNQCDPDIVNNKYLPKKIPCTNHQDQSTLSGVPSSGKRQNPWCFRRQKSPTPTSNLEPNPSQIDLGCSVPYCILHYQQTKENSIKNLKTFPTVVTLMALEDRGLTVPSTTGMQHNASTFYKVPENSFLQLTLGSEALSSEQLHE